MKKLKLYTNNKEIESKLHLLKYPNRLLSNVDDFTGKFS